MLQLLLEVRGIHIDDAVGGFLVGRGDWTLLGVRGGGGSLLSRGRLVLEVVEGLLVVLDLQVLWCVLVKLLLLLLLGMLRIGGSLGRPHCSWGEPARLSSSSVSMLCLLLLLLMAILGHAAASLKALVAAPWADLEVERGQARRGGSPEVLMMLMRQRLDAVHASTSPLAMQLGSAGLPAAARRGRRRGRGRESCRERQQSRRAAVGRQSEWRTGLSCWSVLVSVVAAGWAE